VAAPAAPARCVVTAVDCCRWPTAPFAVWCSRSGPPRS